ncbi:hypothetical protein [Polycladidibacter hongkongensis]|uniref:hypothetical protein n=1 Tax=Polycladidibacter hongkongensis TaxID=1647556 RepID=UPI00082AD288|nr:hypothetical protein [Pseudovibrio hongkongensis]
MSKVLVWLDHQSAEVYALKNHEVHEMDEIDKIWDFKAVQLHVKEPHSHFHMHNKRNKNAGRHSPDEHKFFEEIEAHLKGADEVLIVGPGFAKLELAKHALKHVPAFEGKLHGVETVDHPTSGQLINFARDYFEISAQKALDGLHVLARKHSRAH